MPKEKSKTAKSEPVTKEFLVQQLQAFEKRTDEKFKGMDEKIDQTKKILEAKIDFARKDMREHVTSAIKSETTELNKKIDNLSQEIAYTQMAVKDTKNQTVENSKRLDRIESKLDSVIEKVERHGGEITFLKSAVSQT